MPASRVFLSAVFVLKELHKAPRQSPCFAVYSLERWQTCFTTLAFRALPALGGKSARAGDRGKRIDAGGLRNTARGNEDA
jgi:hypothetical protein